MADLQTESVAEVDQNFEQQFKSIVTQASAAAQQVSQGLGAQWYAPSPLGSWTGDLFDWKGMSSAFDRANLNTLYSKVITEQNGKVGVTGDLVALGHQIEYMSLLERAYRNRHCFRSPRLVAHANGRTTGHGNDSGPIGRAIVDYTRNVLKQAKAQTNVL